ncbi:hypothetical protein WN51_10282 [Melipona quadrifasciata]|uniref:Uncharacterized protein n=1 Tax=Melipona quadrifasciata TaxID=166423 RepID=A0A0N0BI54_9HYME|nr:hypothetical protein WN51_10282 [Melipona quadrifasciata]
MNDEPCSCTAGSYNGRNMASMKWETTNDWNTIVIPDNLYVTFELAIMTWLSPSTLTGPP